MQSSLSKIIPWAWALCWFMIVVSLKGSMLAIWFFALLVIIYIFLHRPAIKRVQLRIILLPSLLFLWYFISWMIHGMESSAEAELISKSALIMLPLLLLLSQNLPGVDLKQAMRGFIAALLLSGIHLLIRAIILALQGYGMQAWTYHAFTEPYGMGAIYYSWYLSIAILYLIYSRPDPLIARYRNTLMIFLLLLLLLASSKLFIAIVIPIALWNFIRKLRAGRQRWLAMAVLALILLGGITPFMNRIQELRSMDFNVIYQDQYSYDTPLNGISLRLIQWRLGLEIIQEEHAWIFGTGPGYGQQMLDMKYTSYGLYTGNEELGDTGYLGYNFHNQYMETVVETGIPGLLILLFLLAGLIIIYRKMLIFPRAVFLVTILFLITESVLERQAGIMVFSMLIAFAPAAGNNSNE